METFKTALEALIAAWRAKGTPLEEIALALEAAGWQIEDQIAGGGE